MDEYKITKEKVLAMADQCPEAEELLRAGFPEAFEEQWENITKEVETKWKPGSTGNYFLRLYFRNEDIGIIYPDEKGIYIYSTMRFKLEKHNDAIRILKNSMPKEQVISRMK